MFFAFTQIQYLLEEGKNVVCDRYYYTTITAYPHLLESTSLNFWENIDMLINKLKQPDFSFFLTVQDKQIRKERLAKRDTLSNDDIESLDDDIIARTLLAYRKFNDLIEIDTSHLTPGEVVDRIYNYIKTK